MAKDNWQTPRDLFDKLDAEFEFDIDVCADANNSKCFFYYDEESNALDGNWPTTGFGAPMSRYPICWMNPPYSKPNLKLFCKKAYEESQKGCTVVGLLPGDLSTGWYKTWVFGKAHEVRTTARRVRFIDPDTGQKGGSPKFGSIIVVWKPGIPERTEFSIYDW